jgi:hypothetical protein
LEEKAEKGESFNINPEFFEILRVLAEHPDPRKRAGPGRGGPFRKSIKRS